MRSAKLPGTIPSFDTPAYFANVAGHAAVGCASAVASGGKCGPSALAGAVTSAAGPFINNIGSTGSLVANAVVGGLAAVAGGGKFENGAITGAFGYLFNAAGGRAVGSAIGGLGAAALGLEAGPLDIAIATAGHFIGGEIGSALEDAVGTALQSFWPTNSGFLGEPTREFLYPGQQIDRYGGGDYSQYFSPIGTPAEMRSLPPGISDLPLRTFEILKPFEVLSGLAAPGFGQVGLGIQYMTPVPLGTLIDRGIIREITP
jgi:hypothetical protein